MSWLQAAFAPRRDHKGMSTPSYAARWWLPLCTALCAVWSWQATDGFLVMAAALTVMLATPLLTLSLRDDVPSRHTGRNKPDKVPAERQKRGGQHDREGGRHHQEAVRRLP